MTFVFAGHEVDPKRQELRRAGQVVHVEPQVFDVLLHLIRNRDRIVSKDELLDAVWDGRIVSEAALSSRINAARRAIGDNGVDQCLIRTIHKRGFRFVGEVRSAESDSAPEEGDGKQQAPPQPDALPPAPQALEPSSEAELASDTGRPSLAVLPFANLSRDPADEYFSYGLTEDVIRLLARNRWLKVLTRHSTMGYRGTTIDAREVGAALGVRYLVQGSVRHTGNHVKITAELVSTGDGSQLWAEVYEFNLEDIFDIQEAMAQQVAAVIEPELGDIERQIAARKAPENLDAWDCYQRGLWHLWGFTTPAFAAAEQLFRRAIDIEPGLARAHAALSYVHIQNAFYGDPKARPALLKAALTAAKTSVALDERDCLCRCVLGRAHCLHRNYDEAIAELETCLDLNPSFAQGYFALGFAMLWSGRQDEAIALVERAAELSPRDPHLWTFHHVRAMAHFALDEFRAAESFARKAVRQPNVTHRPHSTLVAVLGTMGRTQEARPVIADLLAKKPDYSLAQARDDFFFCADQGFIERYVSGLARAGVRE